VDELNEGIQQQTLLAAADTRDRRAMARQRRADKSM